MKKMTRNEAIKFIANMALDHVRLIPGINERDLNRLCYIEPYDESISLTWDRAWAVSANLSIRFERDVEDITDPKTGKVFKVYRPIVEIGWSSTTRNISNATAAIALYRSVTELGALIESVLNSFYIHELKD